MFRPDNYRVETYLLVWPLNLLRQAQPDKQFGFLEMPLIVL